MKIVYVEDELHEQLHVLKRTNGDSSISNTIKSLLSVNVDDNIKQKVEYLMVSLQSYLKDPKFNSDSINSEPVVSSKEEPVKNRFYNKQLDIVEYVDNLFKDPSYTFETGDTLEEFSKQFIVDGINQFEANSISNELFKRNLVKLAFGHVELYDNEE